MKKKVNAKNIQTVSMPLLAEPAVMRSLLPAIKGGIAGCLNCGYTEDVLPMKTKLYNGFGGWTITKSGRIPRLCQTKGKMFCGQKPECLKVSTNKKIF